MYRNRFSTLYLTDRIDGDFLNCNEIYKNYLCDISTKITLWLVIVFDNVGFKRVFSFLLHSNSAGDMLYAFGSVEWYNKLTKNIAE